MLEAEFTATMRKSASKGGWTYVVWPESVTFFRTRGLVTVRLIERIDQPGSGSFVNGVSSPG
ncbi:hypothetical protein [Rhodococcus maanshanensis]|uniref:DUF1905 domain-containing protein n=1 Tax=Rhodococcus maanshanensis TaxID=183556 RepID=A0A1H7HFT0_9NOCA|nr:hypothetical protein [Rhodococcus maanshanensis]SEK49236.1 protein of unknown function [Rhodococcus maanshanensis]